MKAARKRRRQGSGAEGGRGGQELLEERKQWGGLETYVLMQGEKRWMAECTFSGAEKQRRDKLMAAPQRGRGRGGDWGRGGGVGGGQNKDKTVCGRKDKKAIPTRREEWSWESGAVIKRRRGTKEKRRSWLCRLAGTACRSLMSRGNCA